MDRKVYVYYDPKKIPKGCKIYIWVNGKLHHGVPVDKRPHRFVVKCPKTHFAYIKIEIIVAKSDQRRPEIGWYLVALKEETNLTFKGDKKNKGIKKITLKNDISVFYELNKLNYFKFDNEDQVCEFYEELKTINRRNPKYTLKIKYISGLCVYCVCKLKNKFGNLIDEQ